MALQKYRASFDFELDLDNAVPGHYETLTITLPEVEQDILDVIHDALIENADNIKVVAV